MKNMKKKTRMIALLLVLALSFAMLPQMVLTAHAAASSGVCGAEGDNLTWTLDIDLGVLTIEGSGKMADFHGDGSPWYDDREVIETVVLPEGLTSIGVSAFEDCDKLTGVTIPATVTEIGERAFRYCGLTELTIPDHVTKIGEYAFAYCNLSSVTIPAAVTEIGNGAFAACCSEIHVVPENPAYCSLDGVLFNNERTVLLQYPSKKPGSVYEIPEGVKTFANDAFYQNSYLTVVTVPSSVETIAVALFKGCYRLTELRVASDNQNYSSLDGVLFNKDRTELLQYPRAKTDASYTVPDGVQRIGYEAFFCCDHLQTLTISNSVTTLEDRAFYGCDALTAVTLPDSIAYVGWDAFGWTAYSEDENNWDGRLLYLGQWLLDARDEILTADIREGTLGIAGSAFCDCVSLQSVSIPDSVKVIGENAFANCESLANVTIGNGVTEIGAAAFCGCASLKTLALPDSLTSIGDHAFCYCSAMESIAIPAGVTGIPAQAFLDCTSLKQVNLPNSITKIEEAAFLDCTSLQSISIPGSVTEIGNYAFYMCSALEDVTISEGVMQIGHSAFYGCPKLRQVEIPASVTVIDDLAFGYGWGNPQNAGYRIFVIYGDKDTAAQRYAKENSFTFVLRPSNNSFVDVKKSDFFFTPVMWALGNDVTAGIDETHFSPDKTVMRSDAMTFLWAANKRPEPTTTKSPFKDVGKKHWAFKAIMWGVENEITGGTGPKTFSPDNTCSRSEILQFLYAAMWKPKYTISNPYSDLKPKQWYYDGAIWAYEKGLERGENGKFKAKTPCTRGYVVTYLYRFFSGNELAE